MKKRELLKRIIAFILAVLMVFVTIGTGIPVNSYANNGDEDEDSEDEPKDIDAMKAELADIEEQRKAAQAEADAVVSKVNEKENELAKLNDQVNLTQDEIDKKQKEIDKQTDKINKQQKEIEDRYEGLGNRLRNMYKNGSIGFFDVLFGSSSFSELLSNIEMVKMVYESDKNTLEELHDVYNELKDALDELDAKKEELTKAKEQLQDESQKVEVAKEELEEEAQELLSHVGGLDAMAEAISAEILAEQQRIEAELEAKRKEEERRAAEARAAEQSGGESSKLTELEEKISSLESRIKDLEAEIEEAEANKAKKDRVAELQAELDAIQAEIDELEAVDKNAEGFDEDEYNARYNEKIEERDSTKASLEEAIDAASEIGEVGDIDAMKSELEDLKSQLEAAKKEKEELTSTDSSYVSSELYGGGSLAWPLKSSGLVVLWEYGPRDNSGMPRATSYHRGMDLWFSGCAGQPIYASASGIVSSSGYRYSYGNCVFISHGYGVTTAYAHMVSVAVGKDEYVQKGQVIGYVGDTGDAYGAHLHFEVWYNGEKVNPRNFLE